MNSQTPTTISLEYGKQIFDIDVYFSDRRDLKISVHPDLSIVVLAPDSKSFEEIKPRIEKRISWISRNVADAMKYHPHLPERQYIAGETHSYLGRQYRLKLVEEKEKDVKLKGRYFHVYTPNPHDPGLTKKLMSKWFKDHAISIFYDRYETLLKLFKSYQLRESKLSIRLMKTRWGSCNPKGSIVLNTELVKTPLVCVDYVIVHELCHLIYPNHDYKFFRLLGKVLPDWRQRKAKLDFFQI